ncbi:MAG TPA: hypothetical protein VFS72_16135 [Agromyces sp.]|nr:hypothetical protein [Agromyces sp.]
MSRIERNAEHRRRDDRRRADDAVETWDDEGGAPEHRSGESDANGRAERWSDVHAEHWHHAGYSEQTRERSEEDAKDA